MARQKVELPLVLARTVTIRLPARAEANVIVDDAVIDERAAPEVVAAHVALDPVRLGNELGIGHIGVVGNQVIGGQTRHLAEVIRVDLRQRAARCPRVDRTVPRRHAIVDEERKVGLRVFGGGGHNAASAAVDGLDAVAQQIAIAHQRGRQRYGVAVVAGGLHHVGRPRRGVGRVGEADVAARRHRLQPQPHRADAVRVRHVRADGNRVARGGRDGLVGHGVDEGRRVAGEHGIGAAGRGRAGAPGARHGVVGIGCDKADRSLDDVARHRPGEAHAVRNAVDLLGAAVAQDDVVTVVAQAPLPGAKRAHAVAPVERPRLDRYDQIAARLDDGADGKGVLDPAVERPAVEADCLAGGVVEFHEFQEIGRWGWVVVNFVDDNGDGGRCILGGVQRSGLQRKCNQGRTECQQEFGPKQSHTTNPAGPARPSSAGSWPARSIRLIRHGDEVPPHRVTLDSHSVAAIIADGSAMIRISTHRRCAAHCRSQ